MMAVQEAGEWGCWTWLARGYNRRARVAGSNVMTRAEHDSNGDEDTSVFRGRQAHSLLTKPGHPAKDDTC